MNSKDVIDIIETICDKLGIAVNSFSEFVPELMKYKVSLSAFWMISSLLIIVISSIVIRYTIKRARKIYSETHEGVTMDLWDYNEFPSVYVSSVVGGVLILILLIVFLFNLKEIVVWIASPKASAVNYILSYFK